MVGVEFNAPLDTSDKQLLWIFIKMKYPATKISYTSVTYVVLVNENDKHLISLENSATHITRHGIVVSGVRRINEVNPRRARLVLGWVTVFAWVYHLGM